MMPRLRRGLVRSGMESFIGWLCFILLSLWAIWRVLTNPAIIGFALKVLAGLLVLYVCIEAFVLIGRRWTICATQISGLASNALGAFRSSSVKCSGCFVFLEKRNAPARRLR